MATQAQLQPGALPRGQDLVKRPWIPEQGHCNILQAAIQHLTQYPGGITAGACAGIIRGIGDHQGAPPGTGYRGCIKTLADTPVVAHVSIPDIPERTRKVLRQLRGALGGVIRGHQHRRAGTVHIRPGKPVHQGYMQHGTVRFQGPRPINQCPGGLLRRMPEREDRQRDKGRYRTHFPTQAAQAECHQLSGGFGKIGMRGTP